MTLSKMTCVERKAVFCLSAILSLRMLGLFMVLPLFALYAARLQGATPFLIGLAMGVYGLTQAILQIPFGALSDHFGRKKIIALGLCIFMLGSLLAAMSQTIWGLLLGRALQGAGAIGSTVMALIADLTRPEQRTKAMAIAGITIGISFSLAMVVGPILATGFQLSGIFWVAVLCGVIAIMLLYIAVPTPEAIARQATTASKIQEFAGLLQHPALNYLNLGVFLLHVIFTASFVVIPISLQTLAGLKGNQQWVLYLPTLLLAFLLSIACILFSEKKHQIHFFFIGGIVVLALSEFLLWLCSHHLLLSALSLLLFFTAFSLLEAFLPSLVSRTAPPHSKGTALGLYSCSQFLGIFVGGIVGGWLYGALGATEVYLFCAIIAIIWSAIAFTMKNTHYSITSHS